MDKDTKAMYKGWMRKTAEKNLLWSIEQAEAQIKRCKEILKARMYP